MAEKSRSHKDSFVSKVVADPANVPDTLLLAGWLGDSSLPNHTRLYFDPQLSNYVEIPDDAILHHQDQPDGSSLPGASYVWIKKEALLTHKSSADKARAKFLEGPIAQQYGYGAGQFPQPQGGPTIPNCFSVSPQCIVTRDEPNCSPTHDAACITRVANVCPTLVGCPPPTQVGCTPPTQVGCLPQTHAGCVTHVNCPPTVANCPSHVCPTFSTQFCVTRANCPSVHICTIQFCL